jgi:hypothetical protein
MLLTLTLTLTFVDVRKLPDSGRADVSSPDPHRANLDNA